MSLLLSLQGAIGQGILWGIMALGVYITFRILDIADLTVDGSFATGGAVCAVAIISGINPILSIILAILAGFAAGFITGFLHTKCKMPAILAGILTQLALYSINLRIMGKSNVPLLQSNTMFKDLANVINVSSSWITIIIGVIFSIVVIVAVYWFLGTEYGSALRATGNNENMVKANGVNTDNTKLIGLMISNGLVALSGALVTQQQSVADVKMGTGAIVIGLASIVIGEVIFGKKAGFKTRLVSIIVGSIIYRLIVAIVLQMGLNTDDLKLLTALIVAIALTVPIMLDKQKQVRMYKKLTGKDMNENA
jgi:putative ABC transport system permease protein